MTRDNHIVFLLCAKVSWLIHHSLPHLRVLIVICLLWIHLKQLPSPGTHSTDMQSKVLLLRCRWESEGVVLLEVKKMTSEEDNEVKNHFHFPYCAFNCLSLLQPPPLCRVGYKSVCLGSKLGQLVLNPSRSSFLLRLINKWAPGKIWGGKLWTQVSHLTYIVGNGLFPTALKGKSSGGSWKHVMSLSPQSLIILISFK